MRFCLCPLAFSRPTSFYRFVARDRRDVCVCVCVCVCVLFTWTTLFENTIPEQRGALLDEMLARFCVDDVDIIKF